MASVPLLLLLVASMCSASPPLVNLERNTIFQDEKFEGEVFYKIDESESPKPMAAINYRLPTTTKPVNYKVLIATDFGSTPRMIAGEVRIRLKATEPNVNEIVIHADELNIHSVSLSYNGDNIPVSNYFDNEENLNFLRIALVSGTLQYSATEELIYELFIPFEAPMRTDMYGIYESWYVTGGETRYMATTQFQATSARQAFPCYDEPSFKATFDITIRRPRDSYKSWSCTRIAETVDGPTMPVPMEDDIYTTTPVMSTYLIALIVAEYDSITLTNSEGQLIYEVIARPDAIAAGQGQYAFDVGIDLLKAMDDHTNYDFYSIHPNLKMTQASIPDFSAGAMENWGLLTYREAYLMYDEAHTDNLFKQRIAYILSHEIAHMWFGNLVTCDWWDVLWLNEGFARYYQYYLTHWVEDYMGLDTRFITEQVHTSLLADSSNNPQPLTNPGIGSPASVSSMFSTISYNKGAAIIRMTEHLLGTEVHSRGLQNYLQSRKFNTALPIHLFTELQEEAERSNAIVEYGPDFSVIDYYKSWTEQGGHPVLIVTINHQTGEMIILQRRFNINTGFSSMNTAWIIPINFATASSPDFSNTKPTHIISNSVTVINTGSIGIDDWVILNIQQIGHYRVNYDTYTWDLITLALRGPERELIHEYNRAQIVNDVFQFARSGLMSYTRAFNILSFLEFETAYAPWVAAMTGFTWIRNRVTGQPEEEKLRDMIVQWANTVMNEIGYIPTTDESFMRSYLRLQLAPIMCQLNVRQCRDSANLQFQNLRDNAVEVPVDSRIWVYCNGLREGTEEDYDFLWNRFLTHHVYTEKILLLQVLGCTPHERPLNEFLTAIVENNEIIRRQDYTTAFSNAVAGNEDNRHIVFDYIKDNLELVRNGFNSYTTPLSYISSRLRTEQEVTEFRAWATSVQSTLGASYTAVYNGAGSSLDSIAWAMSVSEDLNVYFNNGYQTIETSTPRATTPANIITIPPPHIVDPGVPEMPDSATSIRISYMLCILAIFAKLFNMFL